MPKTQATSNDVLNALLRNVALQIAQSYAALHNADPTDAGLNEISGGSYARQAVTFDVPSAGATANSADVDFTDMPAETVTHCSLWDASTVGNMLYYGSLTASKTVNAGDTFSFLTGDLDVTES